MHLLSIIWHTDHLSDLSNINSWSVAVVAGVSVVGGKEEVCGGGECTQSTHSHCLCLSLTTAVEVLSSCVCMCEVCKYFLFIRLLFCILIYLSRVKTFLHKIWCFIYIKIKYMVNNLHPMYELPKLICKVNFCILNFPLIYQTKFNVWGKNPSTIYFFYFAFIVSGFPLQICSL